MPVASASARAARADVICATAACSAATASALSALASAVATSASAAVADAAAAAAAARAADAAADDACADASIVSPLLRAIAATPASTSNSVTFATPGIIPNFAMPSVAPARFFANGASAAPVRRVNRSQDAPAALRLRSTPEVIFWYAVSTALLLCACASSSVA